MGKKPKSLKELEQLVKSGKIGAPVLSIKDVVAPIQKTIDNLIRDESILRSQLLTSINYGKDN